MSSAFLKINMPPRRILSEKEAALYCGHHLSKFKARCPVVPILFPSGEKKYDMPDLDKWLDELKGAETGTSDDAILARLG
jgi:hypothetical protein